MSKFHTGDVVRVLSSKYDDLPEIAGMIGNSCKVRGIDEDGSVEVWENESCADFWFFSDDELELIHRSAK